MIAAATILCVPAILCGQAASSSGSSGPASSGDGQQQESSSGALSSKASTQPSLSGITLETNEPLFYLAAALNMCGYDEGVAESNPVRGQIRQELNDAMAASAPARDSRDALCAYVQKHKLGGQGQDLAQYVSLAVYLTPPPELEPTVGEPQMPPDSTQVVNILPLVRTLAEAVRLHTIWIEHRQAYEALIAQVSQPLRRMIFAANLYLRQNGNAAEGHRFVVLLEPMLAPSETNARIYGTDYFVVSSPLREPPGAVHMEQIKHTYLQYSVEPLVYSRSSAMDRLLPLLRTVQGAPLDFTYKSDIVALLSECLIKAIEARTMDVGLTKPTKPGVVKERAELERYDAAMNVYERQAEGERRALVNHDLRQGWVLTDYFYGQLINMEHQSLSLQDWVGPMIYSMDVDGERKRALQIAFLPEGSEYVVRRAQRQATGMDLAEMKLVKGDSAGAEEIAQKTLADPQGDHGAANYLLARLALMQSDPDEAIIRFEQALKLSKDPRTLAWSHIYLGRMYDSSEERPKAIEEYKAALAARDAKPDTKAAAESGLKKPYALPKREQAPPDDAPLDPSGKAEKDAYRPDSAK